MNYVIVPGTNRKLFPNTILILKRLPDVKWILKYGTYAIIGEPRTNLGWYLVRIASMDFLPLNEADLVDVIVVSCPCQPIPEPLPDPETPEYTQSLERYVSDRIYFKDQLLYIDEGVLYETTKKFNSSSSEADDYLNLEIDLEAGNVVRVLPEDYAQIFERFEQVDESISQINTEIEDILLEIETKQQKSTYLTNIEITAFTPSTTYADYPYQGTHQDVRFTDNALPHVYFSGADVLSGDFAPISLSENETLYIYSKIDRSVTIPVIVLENTRGD